MFQYANVAGIARQNNATACFKTTSRWYAPWTNYAQKRAWQRLRRTFPNIHLADCSQRYHVKHVAGDQTIVRANSIVHDTEISGYLETFLYIDPNVHQELQFNAILRQQAQTYLQRFAGKTTVGVHVRIKDVPTHKCDIRKFPAYLQRAFQMMETRYPHVQFVLASDDIKACKRQPYLSRANLHFVDEPHSPELDMAILSLCDHIVLTYGTFGWWSAFLGAHARNGTVVFQKDGVAEWQGKRAYNQTQHFLPTWTALA